MIRLFDTPEDVVRSTPLPMQTESYTVIPNSTVIDTIKHTVEANNFKIINAKYRATLSGAVVTGFLNFKGNIDELGVSVGFTNSYNKSRTLKIGCGSVVWVCDNGMISADFGITRKHTGAVDNELPLAMEILIDMVLEEHNKNILQRNEMMTRVLTERERAAYFGVLLFELNLINSVQASALQEEMKNKDSAFQGSTLWDAYNKVTEILKTTHPAKLLAVHLQLHAVTQEMFNMTV